jgi:hypothetical protein
LLPSVSMPSSAARAWSSGFFLDLRVFDIFCLACEDGEMATCGGGGGGNYLGDDKRDFLICVCDLISFGNVNWVVYHPTPRTLYVISSNCFDRLT